MAWRSETLPSTATTRVLFRLLRTQSNIPRPNTSKYGIISYATLWKKGKSHYTMYKLLNSWPISSPKPWTTKERHIWSLNSACWILTNVSYSLCILCIFCSLVIYFSSSLRHKWLSDRNQSLMMCQNSMPMGELCSMTCYMHQLFLTLLIYSIEADESVRSNHVLMRLRHSMPMDMFCTGTYYTHLSSLTYTSLSQRLLIQSIIPHSDEALKILCRWTYTEPKYVTRSNPF